MKVCHRGALTDDLPKTCVGCHEKDDPHKGRYRACEGCHIPKSLAFGCVRSRVHEVSVDRPSCIGRVRVVSFESRIHRRVAGVRRLPQQIATITKAHSVARCGTCHNPNGWDRWQFDHDTQTTYPLVGRTSGSGVCRRVTKPQLPTKLHCRGRVSAATPRTTRTTAGSARIAADVIRPNRLTIRRC